MRVVNWCFVLILTLSSVILAQTLHDKKQLKPALVIIDIQNQYLPYMSESDKKLALEMINASILLFRQYNLPIIQYITQILNGDQNPIPKNLNSRIL
jgi:hypothetical protein